MAPHEANPGTPDAAHTPPSAPQPTPAAAEHHTELTADEMKAVEKWLTTGSWAAVGALYAFNADVRSVVNRALNSGRLMGLRLWGHSLEELGFMLGGGWTFLETSWVMLSLVTLCMHTWIRPWGPFIVIPMFLFTLVVKHFEKAYLVRSFIDVLVANGFGHLVRRLDLRNPGRTLAGIKKLMSDGTEIPLPAVVLGRKVQNVGHYGTLAQIMALVPYGVTGNPWLFIIPASLSGLILWEISCSAGNNTTVEGYTVVMSANGKQAAIAKKFAAVRRIRSASGTVTWETVEGHKPALPWFQHTEQLIFASVLAIAFVVPVSMYVVREVIMHDYDGDGITDTREIAKQSDPWNADTWGLGVNDKLAMAMGFNFHNHKPSKQDAAVMIDAYYAAADSAEARHERYEHWKQFVQDSIAMAQDSLAIYRRTLSDSARIVLAADSLRHVDTLDSLSEALGVTGPDDANADPNTETVGTPVPVDHGGGDYYEPPPTVAFDGHRDHLTPAAQQDRFQRSKPGAFFAGLTGELTQSFGFGQSMVGMILGGIVFLVLVIVSARLQYIVSLLMFSLLLGTGGAYFGGHFGAVLLGAGIVYVLVRSIDLISNKGAKDKVWFLPVGLVLAAAAAFALRSMVGWPLLIAVNMALMFLAVTLAIAHDRMKPAEAH